MKIWNLFPIAAISCGFFFSSGCRTVTTSELTKNYYRVEPGMTEKQVTAILGMQERSVGDTVRWEASRGPDLYSDLVRVEVIFDRDRRVLFKKLTPMKSKNPPPEPYVPLPKYNPYTGRDGSEVLSREAGL